MVMSKLPITSTHVLLLHYHLPCLRIPTTTSLPGTSFLGSHSTEPLQGSHLVTRTTTRSFLSSVAVPVAPFELQLAPSTLQRKTFIPNPPLRPILTQVLQTAPSRDDHGRLSLTRSQDLNRLFITCVKSTVFDLFFFHKHILIISFSGPHFIIFVIQRNTILLLPKDTFWLKDLMVCKKRVGKNLCNTFERIAEPQFENFCSKISVHVLGFGLLYRNGPVEPCNKIKKFSEEEYNKYYKAYLTDLMKWDSINPALFKDQDAIEAQLGQEIEARTGETESKPEDSEIDDDGNEDDRGGIEA
ncbi:hypothetical protein F5876DRAFT_70418 [Lentinula aff. lateritia]|uniref:Uncharacterized protein n=1 Tax=Lentinula aff. lateritia TaxID=2804960 RepID=A0ACC1TJ21_9AGAR|nr:hypothetical protein F5876DRAFT_70418 [Lentinula aff. lateritia]